jgi:hypothetical protein
VVEWSEDLLNVLVLCLLGFVLCLRATLIVYLLLYFRLYLQKLHWLFLALTLWCLFLPQLVVPAF